MADHQSLVDLAKSLSTNQDFRSIGDALSGHDSAMITAAFHTVESITKETVKLGTKAPNRKVSMVKDASRGPRGLNPEQA